MGYGPTGLRGLTDAHGLTGLRVNGLRALTGSCGFTDGIMGYALTGLRHYDILTSPIPSVLNVSSVPLKRVCQFGPLRKGNQGTTLFWEKILGER